MTTIKNVQDLHGQIMNEFGRVIIGYGDRIELLLACILANGHVLLEGVPGISKTTIAKALARGLNLREKHGYQRIQCTPDLMPSDVVGTMVYDPKKGGFEPHFGPIFAHLLLVDEINRAVPRTQSALLQAMQEREVTIGGTTYKLDEPFFVAATQNPIEQEGVYPLPEAQLDRFIMKIKIDYPHTLEDEIKILDLHERRVTEPVDEFSQIVSVKEICDLQKTVAEVVEVPAQVKRYVAEIIRYTRTREEVSWGSSPRAGIFLMRAAKSYAAMHGREVVDLDDVNAVASAVLNHRIILKPEKEIEGVEPEQVIEEVLKLARKTVTRSV